MIPDLPEEDRQARIDAAREVERLAVATAASNVTMTRLVEKVSQDAEKRERKVELLEAEARQLRQLLLMVGIAIALLLIVGAFNAYNTAQTRKQADQSAQIAKDSASTNRLLLGCFDVNSQCSKLNAEKQKQILDEIKLYELTALYCVRTNPAQADPKGEDFLACVKRLYPAGPTLKGR